MDAPTVAIDSPGGRRSRRAASGGNRAVRDPRIHRALELIHRPSHARAEIAGDLGVSKAIEALLANNHDRIRKLGCA